MTFQSSVISNIGFGVVGELFLDGPLRAQPARIVSDVPANNVFGTAFALATAGSASFETSADPAPMTVRSGGPGVFAGILAFPKEHVLAGTATEGTLASSLTLPNNTIATFVQETTGLIVRLPALFTVGDWVWYNIDTGVLVSTPPGSTAPTSSLRVPNGRVVRYGSAAAGLAVIEFDAKY